MASGTMTIRLRSGKLVRFYTAAGPTKIDGRETGCAFPPEPPLYRRNPVMCERWPADVRVGITRVRVPYWRHRRDGHPALIARDFTVVK
jgi:hypothetical protein